MSCDLPPHPPTRPRSLALTRTIGAAPWRRLLPQCGLIVGFMAELWYLIGC